uniref:3CxxC-type domain-containing protein n=1 Tax=Leptobrachium leishanense TaxID=445787 RepID=A0A8C5MP38_9ANUR
MTKLPYWRKIFREKIHQYYPKSSWKIKKDNKITEEEEEGWEAYTERDAYGRFQCSWCDHEWTSIRVIILFLIQLTYQEQGIVKMRYFGQQCTHCQGGYEQPYISEPILNKIIENVVNRIREWCYGENNVPAPFPVHDKTMHGPHRRDLCEAYAFRFCPTNAAQYSYSPITTNRYDSTSVLMMDDPIMESQNIPEPFPVHDKTMHGPHRRDLCEAYAFRICPTNAAQYSYSPVTTNQYDSTSVLITDDPLMESQNIPQEQKNCCKCICYVLTLLIFLIIIGVVIWVVITKVLT